MAVAVQAAGVELCYGIERAALPSGLAARVIELEHDEPAQRFVADALGARHGALRTGVYRLLRRAMSDYDAYGLLGMYPMHLLSTPQAARLLGRDAERPTGTLLDVGAGNGSVTAVLAPLFERVCVTEASRVMRRVLSRRGLTVTSWDLTRAPAVERFDVVTCLNVLDRCARPRSLLQHLRASLTDAGVVLLSVPLPLSPHVHVGADTVAPDEPLPEPVAGWEQGAAELAHELFVPAGLEVRALSRVPYLCRGDARGALHALDAAVFVLRARPHRQGVPSVSEAPP